MIKSLLFIFIPLSLLLGNNSLTSRIEKVVSLIPSSTIASVYILNATTNENVYAKNINNAMIPASNTKLFTTAAALNLLGTKYFISTNIFTDGEISTDGILEGDLYIKGFGHSTFETKDLDSLIKLIKLSGIKKINGNVIGDDTYFDKLYTRDEWIIDERANVKLPPVSALVINKNQFVIKLDATGPIGSKLKYSLEPECTFIKIDVSAEVTSSRTVPRIRSSFDNNQIVVKVTGGLRKRRSQLSYVVNIQNPPLYFALLLKDKLQEEGIEIEGEAISGKSPQNRSEIASVGITVDSLISLINKNSNNYLAECLFKLLGAFYSWEEGNSFYATQAVLSSFADEFIIDDETAVVDGSGISRFNTITTSSIVRLLNKLYKDGRLFEEFYKSLAISGIDGTLKDRNINNFVRGNFHGKTGTLNGVTALSGYLTGKNNDTYIVSIIMEYKKKGSNFHKEIEDKILLELSK
jgi:PBP4 family serine-type D-alanyl-D-alanine carboxypeptidase